MNRSVLSLLSTSQEFPAGLLMGVFWLSDRSTVETPGLAECTTALIADQTLAGSAVEPALSIVNEAGVPRAVGKVSFRKAGGSKRLSVDKRSGKMKVKKGTRKGLYKLKIIVTVSGGAVYASATRTVSIKVRVR